MQPRCCIIAVVNQPAIYLYLVVVAGTKASSSPRGCSNCTLHTLCSAAAVRLTTIIYTRSKLRCNASQDIYIYIRSPERLCTAAVAARQQLNTTRLRHCNRRLTPEFTVYVRCSRAPCPTDCAPPTTIAAVVVGTAARLQPTGLNHWLGDSRIDDDADQWPADVLG